MVQTLKEVGLHFGGRKWHVEPAYMIQSKYTRREYNIQIHVLQLWGVGGLYGGAMSTDGLYVPGISVKVYMLNATYMYTWNCVASNVQMMMVWQLNALGQLKTKDNNKLFSFVICCYLFSVPEVILCVTLVPDQPQKIKSWKQSGWQLNVSFGWLAYVVASIGRVSCSKDWHSSIECSHDTSLG